MQTQFQRCSVSKLHDICHLVGTAVTWYHMTLMLLSHWPALISAASYWWREKERIAGRRDKVIICSTPVVMVTIRQWFTCDKLAYNFFAFVFMFFIYCLSFLRYNSLARLIITRNTAELIPGHDSTTILFSLIWNIILSTICLHPLYYDHHKDSPEFNS